MLLGQREEGAGRDHVVLFLEQPDEDFEVGRSPAACEGHDPLAEEGELVSFDRRKDEFAGVVLVGGMFGNGGVELGLFGGGRAAGKMCGAGFLRGLRLGDGG